MRSTQMIWDWKSIGSLLATLVFLRTAINDFLPPEFRYFLVSLFSRLYSSLCPATTIIMNEYESDLSNQPNELFVASKSYLSSSSCLSSAPVLCFSKTRNSKSLVSSLPSHHSSTDFFRGARLNWTFETRDSRGDDKQRRFVLSFHRRHRDMVHSQYFPFILEEAAKIKSKLREKKLYTNRHLSPHSGNLWSSVPFNHPSTLDTMAIDPGLRDSIRSDLVRFTSRRDYYARTGRAWKRGYLLYGPPGTGKTSLIAAIANFLEFDIYDLELTTVRSNSDLRSLLFSTTAKSVIVIEDIDCSLDFSNRKKKKKVVTKVARSEEELAAPPLSAVSLSGVLNFVDGLWSSCVGERVIIFTSNHPDKLDPALLRPGRMDKKIELSYCEPAAFRMLVKNYLEIDEHETMEEAEGLLKELVRMTPAEIAEVFLGCEGDAPDVAMKKVVEEMKQRSRGIVRLDDEEER